MYYYVTYNRRWKKPLVSTAYFTSSKHLNLWNYRLAASFELAWYAILRILWHCRGGHFQVSSSSFRTYCTSSRPLVILVSRRASSYMLHQVSGARWGKFKNEIVLVFFMIRILRTVLSSRFQGNGDDVGPGFLSVLSSCTLPTLVFYYTHIWLCCVLQHAWKCNRTKSLSLAFFKPVATRRRAAFYLLLHG